MEEVLFYYRNRSGLVAVSCDEGDTIILPNGKVMEHNDFWEDAQEDLRAELTPQQEAALKRAEARVDNSEMGQIIRKYSRSRKEQERLDGVEHEPIRRKPSDDVLVVVADFD